MLCRIGEIGDYGAACAKRLFFENKDPYLGLVSTKNATPPTAQPPIFFRKEPRPPLYRTEQSVLYIK